MDDDSNRSTIDYEEERYKRAKHRVEEIKSFYQHLTVYVIMMAFLVIVDIITGSGWWFYWVAVAWGLGLAIHGATVFGPTSRYWDSNWEERKIAEIMGEKVKHNEVYFDES